MATIHITITHPVKGLIADQTFDLSPDLVPAFVAKLDKVTAGLPKPYRLTRLQQGHTISWEVTRSAPALTRPTFQDLFGRKP